MSIRILYEVEKEERNHYRSVLILYPSTMRMGASTKEKDLLVKKKDWSNRKGMGLKIEDESSDNNVFTL